MKSWISFTVSNAFYDNGEYKGCYLVSTVLEDLLSRRLAEDDGDDVFMTMRKLHEYTHDTGPVRRHSRESVNPVEDISITQNSTNNELLPLQTDMTMESHLTKNWTQEEYSGDDKLEDSDNVDQLDSIHTHGEGDDELEDIDNVDQLDSIHTESNLTEKGSDIWNRTMDVLDCIQTLEDANDFPNF